MEEQTFDPEKKCLDVAEKIISCLSDTSIIERFKSIKSNIFSNYQNSPNQNIQIHLKQLSYENVELLNKLNELKRRYDQDNQINLSEYALSVINDHINTTSPKLYNKPESLDSACSVLFDVLEAKSEANTMVRAKLNDENRVLRDKISKAEAVANEELKEYRKRRLDHDNQTRQRQKQISSQISQLRAKIQQQSSRYDDLIEENNEIDNAMKEKKCIAKSLMTKLQDAEKRKVVAEKRLKDLQYNLEKSLTQIKAKEREIEAKRATQRFGIDEANENELEIIRELEKSISELYQENQTISLELKKRKLMASSALDLTEVSKI